MKLATLILFFLYPLLIQAQDINVFACKIVQIFKDKDSSAFIHLPIQPNDNRLIFEYKMKGLGIQVENPTEVFNENDSLWGFFKRDVVNAFIQLQKKAVDFGVDWSSVRCDKFNFEIIKNSESAFPTANGIMILQSSPNKIQMIFKGMIKIKDNWRITYINIELE